MTPRLHPEFFDLVSNVRAMRRLKTDPVPIELIRKILDAGVQAPSGQNKQPWAFVLLSEPAAKQWFAERYAQALEERGRLHRDPAARPPREQIHPQMRPVYYQMDHMQEFPYLLLVCGKRDWPFKVPPEQRVGLAPPNYGAVYPCVQNILLAARAVGLGAALTTMHQVFETELQARFGIPEEYGVVVTMPIGWPLGKFGPVTRKPAAESTHFNFWGNPQPAD
ncbi:MAG: nitroreductase family protein [Pseudomonadota bacterium]